MSSTVVIIYPLGLGLGFGLGLGLGFGLGLGYGHNWSVKKSYLALKLYKVIKVVLGHQKKLYTAFNKSIDAINGFDPDADILNGGF